MLQFHRNQKQAPFSFLSPNLAKAPDLSADLSPRLSSISSFLSQLANSFSFNLPKSLLALAPLLLLPYSQGSQALSAQTSQVIHGSAPYLTFDGGQTKATDTNSLLSIELPDGTKYTKSTNPSTATNPIRLVNGTTFNDIHMVLPSGTDSINLNSLITQGKWRDDDGDGQGTNGVTATGSLSLAITDKDGKIVNRGDTLSICSSPYKVTLASTSGTLTTQYGVPKSSTFSGDSVDYYITPPSSPVICSARPELMGGREVGFLTEWSNDKGFLVQSTNPSSYGRNFPTTGSDGLYFDLLIGGVDESQLTWSPVTHSGITATVSWTSPRTGSFVGPTWADHYDADDWISDKTKMVTRVTLTGPEARSLWKNYSPSPITVPSLPQAFELVGRDRSGNVVVKYGFVLKQWFVSHGGEWAYYYDHLSWCNGLGYRMPRVRDLTSAKCGVDSLFPCINGIDGATPLSSDNGSARHIGAGFFSEWGKVNNYIGADFTQWSYLTSDPSTTAFFDIYPENGSVGGGLADSYAVCVTP